MSNHIQSDSKCNTNSNTRTNSHNHSCGERSLACTSDEIRRELKKGFLGYQCTSQDGLSSTNRSTDLTKGETRSIWCQKWSQISKLGGIYLFGFFMVTVVVVINR